MDVSIIIINYNTFELTCNCIQSVIDHTQDLTYEIILIDNASTECSPQLFKEKFGERIQLLVNDENLGFAKGNNVGIKQAKGKTILLLNSDTLLTENSIKICHDNLVDKVKTMVISPMLIHQDGTVQKQCGRFPSIRLELIELFRLHRLFSEEKRGKMLLGSFFDHQSKASPDWIWGTFFMFKRNILEYFPKQQLDDQFFMYGEDEKWCWDIRRLGFYIRYLPDTKVIHLEGKSTEGADLKKSQLIVNHKRDFILECYGSFKWLLFKWLNVFKYASLRNKNSGQKALKKAFLRA